MAYSDKYLAFMGLGPKKIPHWEHWSCPEAETYITGIDYYEHPKLCRQRMAQLYPQLELPIPETDKPKPRPSLEFSDNTSSVNDKDQRVVRWGDSVTGSWDHGEKLFNSAEDVFAFSPLAKGDFRDMPVVEALDFRDEEALYQHYRKQFPVEWDEIIPEEKAHHAAVGFYNTMFMWPLLTFGWELFLETCLDERFERIMDEFAEINRRVFRVFSRLPVSFVVCHDDIVTSRGPVCSPAWMNKYIFPRYEEFWGMVKASGKRVIFMADGCIDTYVDNIFTCGASGIVTEPYSDFKAIAKKHKNCVLTGEGDNQVLMRNEPDEIKAMVNDMLETARMTGGYLMSVGNHIPWNCPPEAVKFYLELCTELGHR